MSRKMFHRRRRRRRHRPRSMPGMLQPGSGLSFSSVPACARTTLAQAWVSCSGFRHRGLWPAGPDLDGLRVDPLCRPSSAAFAAARAAAPGYRLVPAAYAPCFRPSEHVRSFVPILSGGAIAKLKILSSAGVEFVLKTKLERGTEMVTHIAALRFGKHRSGVRAAGVEPQGSLVAQGAAGRRLERVQGAAGPRRLG